MLWHFKSDMVYSLNVEAIAKGSDMKRKKSIKKEPYGELLASINAELDDLGVETDELDISIEEGPVVILNGEVSSHKEQDLIHQCIRESVGIEDIEDYTQVEGDNLDYDEEYGSSIDDYYEDSYGTEDIYESIEDGEPYIPPTNHIFTDLPKTVRWRKRKRSAS
jgi:hypothetical protein